MFFFLICPQCYQEACQIPGIGKRMADKIEEIMESGRLRKLDYIGEAVPVLELFSNIWGAGAKTAQLWYQQVTNKKKNTLCLKAYEIQETEQNLKP